MFHYPTEISSAASFIASAKARDKLLLRIGVEWQRYSFDPDPQAPVQESLKGCLLLSWETPDSFSKRVGQFRWCNQDNGAKLPQLMGFHPLPGQQGRYAKQYFPHPFDQRQRQRDVAAHAGQAG